MLSTPRDYTEKRDYIRMVTDCSVRYQALDGSGVKTGKCVNLSAKGLLLQCPDGFPEGTRLKVSVSPGLDFTQPLTALVRIIRSQPISPTHGFYLGCAIEEIQ